MPVSLTLRDRDATRPAPGAPLRLLFYLPSLGGGGAERLVAQLATELASRGHEVTLVTDTESIENAGYVASAVRQVRLRPGHGRNVVHLARLIRKLKPDVSMSALSGQNLKHMLAAALAGRLSRAAQSYHGFFEGEPRLLSRVSYLMTPLSSRLMARTVCVSDALRAELLRRFHASARRTVRIYNGVPVRAQETLSAGAQNSANPIILACGRLTPDKNFGFLVRAFARMQHRDARLVILGNGPGRDAIEAEAARLHLQDRVYLPGYRDAASWYEKACCVALSSTREAFGLVVVEALAAGLPVVTTASGGPDEILPNGRFGQVVAQGDEAGFAAALDAALQDNSDPAERIARAREFSMERCVEAYEALFYEIARQ
jgi:glycosyltransferase involved in cell wall biosynthesis